MMTMVLTGMVSHVGEMPVVNGPVGGKGDWFSIHSITYLIFLRQLLYILQRDIWITKPGP